MPMHGHPIVDAEGRMIGIACSRGPRYSKCASCKTGDGKQACDGCDQPLCPACAVAPNKKLDFCPTCAKPAFDWWKENAGGKALYAEKGRAAGRIAFRVWVKANKKQFFELAKPRSEASKQEVPK